MRKLLLVGMLGALAVIGFFVFSSSKPDNELKTAVPTPQLEENETKNVDIKASFAIFTNGTFRIFTAAMYHNRPSDVFIEASNPNIVHVKKAGITWDEFFKTLPMKLTRDCLTTGTGQTFCTSSSQTLKFYLNGRQASNALAKIIESGDQLLVTYGSETDEQIEKQFQQVPSIK